MGDIRVLVASSHPLLRKGVRSALLGSGLIVAFEANDLASAVSLTALALPEVCLVDAALRGGGLIAVRDITRKAPTTAVIVLAQECDDAQLLDYVRAGASGYLSKDLEAGALPQAIGAVLAGEAAVPRRLVGSLMSEVRAQTGATPELVDVLTRREREVLILLRAELSTPEIAKRLFVAPGTVRSHVTSLMRKLDVTDRSALIRRTELLHPRSPAVVL
jgi:DNA-binding NarL/FixJ family response regulator